MKYAIYLMIGMGLALGTHSSVPETRAPTGILIAAFWPFLVATAASVEYYEYRKEKTK